ncbi:MAG: DM13 domain-containing protein [Acidimicrobiia bacterium]|nr:DM13 domain-containing protein [Acidimicrobiia bacterium]MBA3956640.1 DM13 domain-containing protein [Acidimicrobiia bacterium]
MTKRRLRPNRRGAVAFVLVLVAAGCGGASDDVATDRPSTTTTSSPSPEVVPDEASRPRASPRWEPVATFTGDAATETPAFTILDDALQWRVRWRCDTGTLQVTSTPPPRRGDPIVEGACPGEGEGFAIHTGEIALNIEAGGPWEATVEQQIDTPLDEPPLPEMASAPVLAEGEFYEIDNPGTGRAVVYGLADGRRVLRLEDFETVATADLFVWLSQAVDPQTSEDTVSAEYVDLGPLKSTLGNQNYEIPAEVATEDIRSIVIWCEPVRIAYTAAALT